MLGSSTAPLPERFALAGPSRPLDPRINAYRSDLADVALADRVFAPHYARMERCHCVAEATMVRAAPSANAGAVSQIVRGEGFGVLDIAGDWAWGRCLHDDYVGYVPTEALGETAAATHRVITPLALVFAAPDIKAPVVARWPIGSLFAGQSLGGSSFVATDAGFVHARHVAPITLLAPDPVAVAEGLIGQPYLWGGRGGGGIDCSGLVQVALALAGVAAPRDSDLQRALGEDIPAGATLRRGDLIFLPGHVGMMVNAVRLIHANAHWMAVTAEPLADVVARQDEGAGAIVARRRIVS